MDYREAIALAAERDKALRGDHAGFGGAVLVLHEEGTTMFFRYAFAENLGSDQPDSHWIGIYTEHHGFHVYHSSDVQVLSYQEVGQDWWAKPRKVSWRSPLKDMPSIPAGDHPGAFGAERTHDIHTGVDLYCDHGTEVFAVEAGTVVGVIPFTGEHADSPWWHNTWAVLVEGTSGVVCYGEILPVTDLQEGAKVGAGQCLGTVLTVLKKDKGKPMTMLHLELYKRGTREPTWWKLGEDKPENLLDPTPYLLSTEEA